MPEQVPTVGMARKLAAIFSTDVAGYSRLMGEDEEATIRTLTAYRALISSLIKHYRGRVVDAPGDNLLAEFASVVDAVRCAVEIQHALKEKNAELPDRRQMQFRIGINLGDVIVEDERLYGDGVNIAARLESLAIPGGICISGTAYDQVETKLALTYEDLGEQTVKNIAKPVRVYRVVMDDAATALAEQAGLHHAEYGQTSASVTVNQSPGVHQKRTSILVLAGILLIASAIAAVYYRSHPSLNTQPSALLTEEAKSPALPLPDKPSLIIVPFVNMSNDSTQDYFSNGMTDVLTSALSRISSLFVIARNTAFTYQGKAVNVHEISKELGVRYVLEGSVQKAGEHVRIVVQLIDAVTGYHVWSEQYDRPLTDIFALQDEIVQKIVTTLKLQLTMEEAGWVVRKHTDNLEAYDAFLRGAERYEHRTKEANVGARQMFEKAIELDPQYADAYALLSLTYSAAARFQWSTDPQDLKRALDAVQKALTLDDSLSVAYSALSFLYTERKQYDQALAAGERAIALDPNNADRYAFQADVMNLSSSKPADALPFIEQAMRLNPHYPAWYLIESGFAYRLTGRYAEAITALKELIRRSPTFTHAYNNLSESYLEQWLSQQSPPAQATLEEALTEARQGLALKNPLIWNYMDVGYIYLYQRQYEQALAEMVKVVPLAPKEAFSYAAQAEVLSYMGEMEEALEAASQALRWQSDAGVQYLKAVGNAYAVAGRYDEARAPLQRFLNHYPNILPAHLMLAAVYSELGQTAEAQKEATEVLRLNPKFSLEVHKQRMPIKDPTVLERHIAALKKAGLQ